MKRIVSRDNPHFKALVRLAHTARERRKAERTLLDGVHLAQAAVDAGLPLRELLLSETGAARAEIATFAAVHATIPITVFGDALFAEISPVDTPSGLLAVVELSAPAAAARDDVDCVLLDGVQDPGNLGSILRSAAAAGFRQILCSRDCAQAWSPRVLRAGMGAHFSLSIHEGCDLAAFLAGYRGLSVVTRLDASDDLYATPLPAPLAWIFGSEGQGVRAEVAAVAGLGVRIPMPGTAESLNVAAAAAVCLFESVRRRHSA